MSLPSKPRWGRLQRLLRRQGMAASPLDPLAPVRGAFGRVFAGWPLVVLALGLGASAWLAHRTQVLAQADQRAELQARLAGWRERVQGQLNVYLFQVEALGNVAQLDHGLTSDRFDDLAMRTIAQVPSIRSVSYALDDVVRHIHPLVGNEQVLGLNLRAQPDAYRQIEQARRMGLPLVLGPTPLVQGGQGLLIRRPIWLGASRQPGNSGDVPRAAVSLAVNLSDFLGQAGLFPVEGVRLRLRDTEQHRDLWSSHGEAWPPDPVQATVHVPGRSWLLEALPQDGWRSTAAWDHPMFWVGAMLSLVISLLLAKQLLNQRLLQASHTQLLAQSQARARDLDRLAEQQRILRQLGTEAQHTRDRLQALLDAATEVAIIGTTLDGHIQVFNTGAQRLLGSSPEEAQGRGIAEFFEPGSLRDVQAHTPREGRPSGLMPLETRVSGAGLGDWERLTEHVRARPSLPVSWIWRSAGACPVELSLTLGLMTDVLGQSVGFVLVARDVTPQLQAEAALNALNQALEQRVLERSEALEQAMRGLHAMRDDLVNADKWAALGSVVAGVAHDLNTPIGNGLTAASNLEERFQQFEAAFESGQLKRSALQAFLKEGGDLASLITRSMRASAELLQHFKQASVDQTHNQARDFELHEIVSDVLSILQPRLKRLPQQVQAQVPPGITMFSHPGALGQVLMNLVNNALDHGFEAWPEMGRALSEGRVRVHVRHVDDSEVVLCVDDNGLGMDPALQAKVFEPFFTTRRGRGGTGLGLSIVSGLVQGTLGGQLTLTSAPGEGCQFELRLPRHSDRDFSPVRIEG